MPRRTSRSRSATATDGYPRPVAAAVQRLLQNGISGPYALALGGEQYQRVVETAEHGGYPLLEHLRKILDGPIVWAPGVKGAVVLSLRGGDFLFESGQDLSIGYDEPHRRVGPALSRGELQLPRRHAGGGGRAHRVAPGAAGPWGLLYLCGTQSPERTRSVGREDDVRGLDDDRDGRALGEAELP